MDGYIGLMSGTSLDGVDAALVTFDGPAPRLLGTAHLPFPPELRATLLALNRPGVNELDTAALAGNTLADLYAAACQGALADSALPFSHVKGVGCHGQTVRHRPERGYTLQINAPARLAEQTGLTVVADFRSRDIAAGGQGAPLVPAFHAAVFAHPERHRVIVNIGGIANLTDLPPGGTVTGFDCGPGNLLMDGWCERHTGAPYDRDGTWASSGTVHPALLDTLLAAPYFRLPPPKSTGRDDFHLSWLESLLSPGLPPADVQATLLELTARGITDALAAYCSEATEVYLCGGGARNGALRRRLAELLAPRRVDITDTLGIPAEWVEAAAFAWLARQTLLGQPGNLPAVTGAAGPRILGAIYPA